MTLKLAGFRPNSEIIGKFRKLKKILWSFCEASNMTHTEQFFGCRRVLEPIYCSMKYKNIRVGKLPLKLLFPKFFSEVDASFRGAYPLQFSRKNILVY